MRPLTAVRLGGFAGMAVLLGLAWLLYMPWWGFLVVGAANVLGFLEGRWALLAGREESKR